MISLSGYFFFQGHTTTGVRFNLSIMTTAYWLDLAHSQRCYFFELLFIPYNKKKNEIDKYTEHTTSLLSVNALYMYMPSAHVGATFGHMH